MKVYKPKFKSGGKTKGGRYQQSTFFQKKNFKVPTKGIKDKLFDFRNQNLIAEFVNNCKEIDKYVVVNYKYGGAYMAMSIKNMEKLDIFIPYALDN